MYCQSVSCSDSELSGLRCYVIDLTVCCLYSEVSDLVLVDPLSEDLLSEDDQGVWLHHVRHHLLAPLQTLHVAAAVGLARLMLMFGLMEPPLAEAAHLLGDEAINRQVRLTPAVGTGRSKTGQSDGNISKISNFGKFKNLGLQFG